MVSHAVLLAVVPEQKLKYSDRDTAAASLQQTLLRHFQCETARLCRDRLSYVAIVHVDARKSGTQEHAHVANAANVVGCLASAALLPNTLAGL